MSREHDGLLRAVLAAPDDDLPRLVLADWLEEHSDAARAEFIRVQCEIERSSDPAPALVARAAKLLGAHGYGWAVPVREVGESLDGFNVSRVGFRRGFVWSLVVEDERDEFADHAAELFELAPVQRIHFWQAHSHKNRAKCKELRHLRELSVDRAGYEPDVVAELLASKYLGNLVRLEMTADDDNCHLDTEGLRLIGECRNLPSLRELDLSGNWCGWMYDDHDGWAGHLLAGGLVGQLTELLLSGTMMPDTGAELLAASDRVRNLERLDLSGNSLTAHGLITLARSPHLVNLRTLDLRGIQPDPRDTPDVSPEAARAELVARFGDGVLLD